LPAAAAAPFFLSFLFLAQIIELVLLAAVGRDEGNVYEERRGSNSALSSLPSIHPSIRCGCTSAAFLIFLASSLIGC
jgi:hypothetical protein